MLCNNVQARAGKSEWQIHSVKKNCTETCWKTITWHVKRRLHIQKTKLLPCTHNAQISLCWWRLWTFYFQCLTAVCKQSSLMLHRLFCLGLSFSSYHKCIIPPVLKVVSSLCSFELHVWFILYWNCMHSFFSTLQKNWFYRRVLPAIWYNNIL